MFLVLQSCNANESNADSDSNKSETVDYTEKLSSISKSINSITVDLSDSIVIRAYAKYEFNNFWLNDEAQLSKEGYSFIELLHDANSFGLNTGHYSLKHIDSLIGNSENNSDNIAHLAFLDFTLTKNYIKFANHLHNGYIKENSYFTELKTNFDTIDFNKIMVKGELVENLLEVQPKHKEYVRLQNALTIFLKNNVISDTIISIPNFRKDSIKAYEITKSILIKKQYIDSSASGSDLIAAVKLFQTDNGLTPDGLIGKYTSQMLEYSSSSIYFQAAITLEKWRWIEDWGQNYFFANIPEFTFKVYEHDSILINNRTVVGTFHTQTPEIDSKLNYFIVNPEWYVPYSITTGELIPKMKKDPTYLTRNNYAISSSGVTITDIDWENANPATFKYKIKQKSGGSNALGRVKFIFDNKHSVYFHDTPSKSFFNKEIRSYSHGCVRLQDPFDVAEYVVSREQKDGWADLLDTVRVKKITKTFTPAMEYPIHIGYFTSSGDENQKLKTLIDIYQKNDTLLSRFKEFYFESAN